MSKLSVKVADVTEITLKTPVGFLFFGYSAYKQWQKPTENTLRQSALPCTRPEFNEQTFTKLQGVSITTEGPFLRWQHRFYISALTYASRFFLLSNMCTIEITALFGKPEMCKTLSVLLN